MAFPQTMLDLRVDLQINGTWTDVTDYVRTDSPVTIRRGRADEASRPDPQSCTLKLKNNDGRFSPRNPTSPYYGILGRNTPLRVGVGIPCAGSASGTLVDSTSLVAPSVDAEAAGRLICVWGATPVGNITVPGGFGAGTERDGSLSTWQLGNKGVSAGPTGTSTATFSTTATAQAAVSVFVPGSGATISASASGSGLGALVDLTVPVTAGDVVIATRGWSSDPDDDMVRPPFQVLGRPGAWVLLADSGASAGPRLATWALRIDQTAAASRFLFEALGTADNFARVDVVTGATDYFARFTGEVASWPVSWDLAGADVATTVTASGIRRRLGQGASVSSSPLRRALDATSGVIAYWPMEDRVGSTSFASATGGSPMTLLGSPILAADTSFAGSDAVPTFSAAGAKGVVPYTASTEWAVGTLLHVPSGLFDEAPLITVTGMGTITKWVVRYDVGAGTGNLRIQAYDENGASLLDQPNGPFTVPITGGRGYLLLQVAQDGADVDWTLLRLGVDGDIVNAQQVTGTVLGRTCGRAAVVQVGAGDIALDADVVFGHVAVNSDAAGFFTTEVYDALVAWAGDTVSLRWSRLVVDAGILLGAQGFPQLLPLMGRQLPRTFLELLDEAVDTDGGVLIEPKGFLGFHVRGRASKLSQVPSLTLSYATKGHVGYPFEPVDDDQGTVNDVTVTRVGGSSSRAEQLTGPLSVLAPPLGVGRYDTTVDLSLSADDQTADEASWRLHLGTWDEARWPTITTRLEAVPSLIPSVAALDVGDTITLTGLPAWVPPGPTGLILEGYTENLGPYSWEFIGNYSPAGPWRALVTDLTSFSRLDSEGATLAEDLTTTETGMDVATAAGHAVWIRTATHPSEFPFDVVVGGERMSVTAITGATSPQTFTVTRSVNGIVKTHLAGAGVRLAEPAFLA